MSMYIKSEDRKFLEQAYVNQVSPPICSYDPSWPNKPRYDKRCSTPMQFKRLKEELARAEKALADYVENQRIHEESMNKNIEVIEAFEDEYDKWEKDCDEFVREHLRQKVIREDKEYVARTGKCCGWGRAGGHRSCSRRATKGNFCFQHVIAVEEYRRV